jgi:hypothetical protein
MSARLPPLPRVCARALLPAFLLSSAAAAHPPTAIAADARGNVWFSDLEAVWRIRPDGRVEMVRRPVSGRHVHEIRLEPDGSLVGEEQIYDSASERFISALWRIDRQGRERWVLRPTANPPIGAGVWRDSGGARYLAQWDDNRHRTLLLFRRDSRGRVVRLLGPEQAQARFRQTILYNAGGFAFADGGGAWFTDRSALYGWTTRGGARRVVSLCAAAVRSRCTRRADLRGLASAPDGSLFIADAAGRRILRREAGGRLTRVLAAQAPWAPHGVARSASSLYSLEFTDAGSAGGVRVRVRRVDADGRIAVLAEKPVP